MFPKDIQQALYKAAWLFLLVLLSVLTYYYVFPALKQIIEFTMPLLIPFIFALVLAMLIDPLINFFQIRFHFTRAWGTITVMVLFIFAFSGILVFLIYRLLIELNNLSQMIPIWSQWLTNFDAQVWFAKLKSYYFSLHVPDYVLKFVQDSLNGILTISKSVVSVSINWLLGFLASLPYILMVSIVVIMATFFLSKDKTAMLNGLLAKLKPDIASKTTAIVEDLNFALTGFLRAELIIMFLTGFQTAFGLFLLGVDYAFTIGVIAAVAEFLPLIGTGTIFLPWVIVQLFLGNYRFALALTVLYFIIVIVRQIIEPKLLSHSIGIHPLGVVVSLFIGLKVFGAWGIIIGPVTIVIIGSLRRANII